MEGESIASSASSTPIPIEYVDDSELEAIERAFELVEAESSKRCKYSSQPISSYIPSISDIPRRRLPDLRACKWTKPMIPKISFGGRIVYSKTMSEIEDASRAILEIVASKRSGAEEKVAIGFDMEWKPYCFGRGGNYNKVAVVQICVDANRCDVMHIFYSGIPYLLQNLLENSSLVKVGVGISGDRDKMLLDYNVKVQDVEELSSLANRKLDCPPRRWSLSDLCEKLTGKEVDKPRHIRCGNWEMKDLNIAQLKYAATDAFASWYLYEFQESCARQESTGSGILHTSLKEKSFHLSNKLSNSFKWLHVTDIKDP